MSNKDNEGSPNLLTTLIFFFVCVLIAGFLAAVTNDVIYKLLKDYQGLLTGLGAITAALIAYKGAMAKVDLDRKHKEDDERKYYLTRHLHAIRVARLNMGRLSTLILRMNDKEELTIGQARNYWKGSPPEPSGGLVECLNSAAELSPTVLVQLHKLYSHLELCQRITTFYNSSTDNHARIRDADGWYNADIKKLDQELRDAYDTCRVIITLCKEITGSEYALSRDEFELAKNRTEVHRELPKVVPLNKKLAVNVSEKE